MENLVKKYQLTNNETIFEELLEQNGGLITSIAKRFNNGSYEFEELLQVGRIGFYHSVRNFNADKGYKFSTYAYICVENELKNYFKKNKKHNKIRINEKGEEELFIKSIDFSIDLKNDNRVRYSNILEGNENVEKEIIDNCINEWIYEKLSQYETVKPNEYMSIVMKLKDIEEKDIAEQLGYPNKYTVTNQWRRFVKWIKAESLKEHIVG